LFNNREDAGKQLAEALRKYKEKKPLVLAIPRGGVEVGIQVARFLESEFSIIVARKLPYPDNPESGFGAIAEDGSLYLLNDARYWLPEVAIQAIIQEQTEEMNRRISILRQGKPLPEIFNKTIILVDDGIAMGSTMHASVMLCKNKKAKSIVVAAPVAGERVVMELEQCVDDVMILENPLSFHAVAQVYRHWHDVSDKKVLNLLKNADKHD